MIADVPFSPLLTLVFQSRQPLAELVAIIVSLKH